MSFKFYRYLYENMSCMSKAEYQKYSSMYTEKLGTNTDVTLNNEKHFHYFLFNLNELVGVDRDILEKCKKRYFKANPSIMKIEDEYERLVALNLAMFHTASSDYTYQRSGVDVSESVFASSGTNFSYLRLVDVARDDLDMYHTALQIDGVFILVHKAINISVARPVFVDNLYGIYLNHLLFYVVDIHNKKVVYTRSEQARKDKILFDYKAQLQRHLLLNKQSKEE